MPPISPSPPIISSPPQISSNISFRNIQFCHKIIISSPLQISSNISLAIFNFVTKSSSTALCIPPTIYFGNIQFCHKIVISGSLHIVPYFFWQYSTFSTDPTMAQSVSKLFVCFQVMKYTVFTNRETAMLSTRGSLCSVS